MAQGDNGTQTFGDHLDILAKMLFRVAIAAFSMAVVLFFFKETLFDLLLAPCRPDFPTYQLISAIVGNDIFSNDGQIELIATGMSSQFMAHMAYSLYMGILLTSPYIVYELFRYISPALYANERRYAVWIVGVGYALFFVGLAVSYLVLFPFSCRFLSTYSVSEHVTTMLTLDSYLSTFFSLTLLMGVVFQMPLLVFVMSKLGLVTSALLSQYRRHVFVAILVVSAIITPPDIMTLILVALPLYLLYEASIMVVRITEKAATSGGRKC